MYVKSPMREVVAMASDEVLRAACRLPRVEAKLLIEGYRAMAMDRERERAAEEWSEALIRDSSEAQ
jgi:hypothetical protein